MSARIHVVHRIVRTVRIQVPGQTVFCLRSYRILRQKPAVVRIVISGVKVVKPCALIPDAAGIGNLVIEIAVYRGLSEIGVLVGSLAVSASIQNTGGASPHILVVVVICLAAVRIPLAGYDISGVAHDIEGLFFGASVRIDHAAALIGIGCLLSLMVATLPLLLRAAFQVHHTVFRCICKGLHCRFHRNSSPSQ